MQSYESFNWTEVNYIKHIRYVVHSQLRCVSNIIDWGNSLKVLPLHRLTDLIVLWFYNIEINLP